MQDLAMKAYTTTPRDIVDGYINEYFIKGLYSAPLKQQLLLTKRNDKMDVLANAMELQTKFALLNESNNVLDTIIQHLDTNNQYSSSHNSCNQSQQYNANNNSNYAQHGNVSQQNQQSNQNFSPGQYNARNENSSRVTNGTFNSFSQRNINRQTQQNQNNNYQSNMHCYNCNQIGHLARSCQQRMQSNSQRNVQNGFSSNSNANANQTQATNNTNNQTMTTQIQNQH